MKALKKFIALTLSAVMAASSLAAVTVSAAANTAPSAPTGLLTNELENPLNVEAPTFGWLVNDADENEVQTAYEIVVTDEVTNAEVWDSGKVISSEQSYVAYNGNALSAGHPYSWKVKTWDKDGAESSYSEKAYFSTGLFALSDWGTAKWISDGTSGAEKSEGTYNHFWYARKTDTLDSSKMVVKAMAYISGLQDYDLYVNDTEIGRGQSFDYASETRYQGWDITDAVKKNSSKIAVGALVRTYGGGQGRAPIDAGLLGYIIIFYGDGTVKTIVTDNSWKVSKTVPFSGTTTRNGEGDFVENYDASKAQDGFASPDFTEGSSWVAASDKIAPSKTTQYDDGVIGKPIPEMSKPTSYEVEPVEIKVINGVTVADFGVVIPARPEITFENQTVGKSYTIQTGYILNDDGTINTTGNATQTTNMTYIYKTKGGASEVYNAWDHLGFRYIQIPNAEQTFTKDTIKAKVVHTNVPDGRDSAFESSNEMLNKVYELMKRSAIYGVQNEFVDTPTREKGQFTDDARNISEATMATQFEREASKKAIEQFLGSADRYWTENGKLLGRYNSVYPNVDGKRDIPEYSVNMPQWIWNYYMQTGDKAFLESSYKYMKATADYISENINSATGLVTTLAGGDGSANSYQYGIVDWPAEGRFGYDWSGTKNGARTTVNMLSKHAFDVVALAAAELNKTSDATELQSRSDALKTAINNGLFNSDKGLYVDGTSDATGTKVSHISQHANSYALAFDIVPADKKAAVAEYVAEQGMKQGPMTADILAKGLFNAGENTAALRLFTEPRDYGWAKEISKSGTFTWEAWQADGKSYDYSQSHAWGATAASDILRNFAGVQILEAGARKVKIAPVYTDLETLAASVSTERGKVDISYKRTANSFNMTIKIPANMTADISLPNVGEGTYKKNGETVNGLTLNNIGSGTYNFVFEGTITEPEKVIYKDELPTGITGSFDTDSNKYTWTIGETDAATTAGETYTDKNPYANLTVSLGRNDRMEESIIFSGTSVNDNSGSVVTDSQRYILVTPKYNGTFNYTVTFADATSTKKCRVYYRDLGTVTDRANLDLSGCTKTGSSKDTIISSAATTQSLDMVGGHTYIFYTYQSGSAFSNLSFEYSGSPVITTDGMEQQIEIKSRTRSESSVNYVVEICSGLKGTLIAASHNADKSLYAMATADASKNKASISIAVPEDNAEVTFMLWDGISTMVPLSAVISDELAAPPETSAITLDRTNYPLVVGNNSKTDFSDWQERGSSFTLSAAVDSDTYSASNLTWSVEDEGIAYISGTGSSVTVKGKRTGFTKVKAELPDGDSAVCYISVIDNITRSTVQTLELNTSSLSLAVGADATLIPIINPKDVFNNGAMNTSVSWTSSDASVATVDSNGKVTAVSAGTATITVTSNDIGRTAKCAVTVSAGGSASNITAEQTGTIDLTVGGTTQLTAATDSEIIWKSDNSFIADVDENGLVTAYSNSNIVRLTDNEKYNASGSTAPELAEKKTVFENGRVQYDKGTVKIYATAKNGGKVAEYEISVADAPTEVQYVKINKEKINIPNGTSKNITAVVGPASIIDKAITWESSNTDVVTVTETANTVYGTVQVFLEAKSAGTATITASSGGKTDTCTVTVTADTVKVSSVALEATKEINIDEVYKFTPTVTETADNQKLIWVGTDKKVASLNNDGNVKGYNSGTSTIYAVAEDSVTSEQAAVLRAYSNTRILTDSDITELNGILENAVYASCELTVKDSPATLRNLTAPAEAVTDNSATLLWNRATLLDTGDFASYNVYIDDELIANTTKLGYTAENLEADTSYTFKVDAINESGAVLASESITVTTKAAPTEVINVMEAPYNATGDGRHMDTYAIQRAINACPDGGMVYLPEGYIFYSGALFLKSNMTLKVDGTLIGSTDSKDYPLMITRWEGWRKLYQTAAEWTNTSDNLPENRYAHSSIITAGTYDEGENSYMGPYNVENIVICGKGQINANGFKLGYNEGPNQKTGDGGLPMPVSPAIDQSVRSRNMTFHNAQGVYVKDVTVAYSPSWNIHPIMCDSMTFDNIDVITKGNGKTGAADDQTILNGDGLDPENCTNINMFDIFFRTGDDAVALKSGRNKEGNDLDKPNQYIRVTDCVNSNSKGGFGTGSENASGSRDILFQNIVVDTVNLHGIWMKTNPERGGLSENIQFKDMSVTGARYTATISLQYSANASSGAQNPADEKPEYRYITFENITTGSNNYGFEIAGYNKGGVTNYIHDVIIRGCNDNKTSKIDYGNNFEIWDADTSKWSSSHSSDINFYTTGQLEDTNITLRSNASMVREIDNEEHTITVIDIAKPSDVRGELIGSYGQEQTYNFYDGETEITDAALSYGNTMKVTSQGGNNTQIYTIITTESDIAYNDTGIKLKDGAQYVTEVTENSICVKEGATAAQIKGELESVYGFAQTYSIDTTDDTDVTTDNILTVTSNNGTQNKNYTIRIARIWDFTHSSISQANMKEVSGYEVNYKDVIIHSDSASDYINTSVGVHFNGKSPANNRYIAFTPESNGTLTVTAKKAFNGASLRYATNSSFTDGKDILGLSNNSEWKDGTVEVTEGITYYLYCNSSGMEVKSLMFTPSN